jgi:hypothetical protein
LTTRLLDYTTTLLLCYSTTLLLFYSTTLQHHHTSTLLHYGRMAEDALILLKEEANRAIFPVVFPGYS